jgi:protein TonB
MVKVVAEFWSMRTLLVLLALVAWSVAGAQADDTTGAGLVAYGDTCVTTCEVMPIYPGGVEQLYAFLSANARYPKEARKHWIEGKVYVSFVIEKDGTVSSVKLVRGVHPLLDNEAIRVVSTLERWTPGTQFGKPVRVQFSMPIIFTMKGNPPKRVRERRAQMGW